MVELIMTYKRTRSGFFSEISYYILASKNDKMIFLPSDKDISSIAQRTLGCSAGIADRGRKFECITLPKGGFSAKKKKAFLLEVGRGTKYATR